MRWPVSKGTWNGRGCLPESSSSARGALNPRLALCQAWRSPGRQRRASGTTHDSSPCTARWPGARAAAGSSATRLPPRPHLLPASPAWLSGRCHHGQQEPSRGRPPAPAPAAATSVLPQSHYVASEARPAHPAPRSLIRSPTQQMWLSGEGCGQEGRGCQSPGSRPQGLAVPQTGDREASSHGPPLDAHCVTRTGSCFPLKRWSQWDAAREGEHRAWKHQGGRGGHAACLPSASGLHCHPVPTRPGSPRGAGSERPKDGCPVSRNEQAHPGRGACGPLVRQPARQMLSRLWYVPPSVTTTQARGPADRGHGSRARTPVPWDGHPWRPAVPAPLLSHCKLPHPVPLVNPWCPQTDPASALLCSAAPSYPRAPFALGPLGAQQRPSQGCPVLSQLAEGRGA